ncbi:hypothetical protein MIND_01205400 [Mycena indigotica]|uniref:Uncharacterized protein n=1 Tax=Mycena indigotica TaxID=2126181 RepID=A0A8H6S4M6_9AGAR|nr:uncharacterized protein MIND_01205400 [Mycena indigotica]KAF7293060.1 hypothetical protein MIND_01205400 [Mycena indigotica]
MSESGLPEFIGNRCRDIDNCRTIAGILISCLSTVILSTYSSLHPNVPRTRRGRYNNELSFSESPRRWIVQQISDVYPKLIMFLIGLIAPEVTFGLAFRQYLNMKQIPTTSTKHRHGLSLWVALQHQRAALSKLTSYAEISVYIDVIRAFDVADIEDKSKADLVTKFIALTQLVWFVVQILARLLLRLPFKLSELEVATVAFALIPLCTWWLWKDKPQDVNEAIRLSVGREREYIHSMTPAPGKEDEGDQTNSTITHSEHSELLENASSGELLPNSRFQRSLASILTAIFFGNFHSDYWRPRIEKYMAVPIFWTGPWLLDLGPAANGRRNISENSTNSTHGTSLTLQFILSLLFGAVHCGAWALYFPSVVIARLWQCGAVAVIGCPPLALLANALSRRLRRRHPASFVWRQVANTFTTINHLTILSYVVARVVLLVLAFATLRERDLPSGIFVDFSWSSLIPHL